MSTMFTKFWPITKTLEFLNCDLDDFVDEFIKWKSIIMSPESIKPLILENKTAEQAFASCLPIVHPGRTKLLAIQTDSNWICLAGNGRGGNEGDTTFDFFGREFRTERLAIAYSLQNDPGSSQFYYNNEANRRRYIAAHKESRWKFYNEGEPFDWENLDLYKERKIKDRLPLEALDDYCSELGVRLLDPNFYVGKAALFELPGFPQTKVISSSFGC
ncbi:hypothetical protein L0666_08340 [Octadecabacter sp. CECT 8868]|nr:hypothetical protein [Octadecabacter algicola]MCF2904995.1 hypothetical protein [Octadecabacter algicola]